MGRVLRVVEVTGRALASHRRTRRRRRRGGGSGCVGPAADGAVPGRGGVIGVEAREAHPLAGLLESIARMLR